MEKPPWSGYHVPLYLDDVGSCKHQVRVVHVADKTGSECDSRIFPCSSDQADLKVTYPTVNVSLE